MTGTDLKLKRVAMRAQTGRNVTAKALGAAMDPPVTGSRIAHIENDLGHVSDDAAAKYLAALATFRTVPTSDDRAAVA